MSKTALGAAIAMAGALTSYAATAQSSVVIYGIVDSGVAYTSNANAAGDSIFKVPTLTGSLPSRIGFRGIEDLGNGLQAVFVLESGLSLDTGNMGQGNRLFGRQSYVGLKGRMGMVSLGRQQNMTNLALQKSDILGPNLFSISSLDNYIPNSRSDNAVGYVGTFSDFTVGATYSFGRDTSAAGGPSATGCSGEVASDSKACRQVTALLGYDNKSFGVNASYDVMQGNTGAAAGLTTSDSKDRRTTLSGYAMAGQVKIGGGIIARKKVAATRVNDLDANMFFFGASFPLTPVLVLDTQYARHEVKDSGNDSTLTAMRLTNYLSKRTAIYSSLGYMRNSGQAAIALDAGGTVGQGLNQAGLSVGVRHLF